MHVNIKVETRTAGVCANQTRLIGFIDRRLQVAIFLVKLASNVDVGRVSAHANAGQQTPFYQLVRVVPKNVAVLARPWLALIRVDDEVAWSPITLLRHKGPFQAGGKTSPPATAQAGRLNLLYEDLDGERTEALLNAIRRGEKPEPGSTTGRHGSAPEGGPTTLFATDASERTDA